MLRLKVLEEFEGTKAWRDCQADYIRRLNEEGISLAEAEWREGGAPLARMLKQVFAMVGLAWVDANERVEITPAGQKFLSTDDPDGVLSDQMSRVAYARRSGRTTCCVEGGEAIACSWFVPTPGAAPWTASPTA